MKALAIDFETANERRDSACAVGLAWIADGVVTRRAYRLIRPPELRFSYWNVRVHGIRADDVRDAPDFASAMAEFMPDIASTLVLAHNAPFDIGVLRAGLAACGRPVPRLRYLCTCDVARRAWPNEPSHGLAAMAARIGVAFRHHHAEEDAYACARLAVQAAAEAGTNRIAAMAERLGLTPRHASGPAPSPLTRATAIRLRPSPPGGLAFVMRGSTGSRYEVAGSFSGEGYALRCTCMAGLNGRRCRHVTALLDGEIGDILSENWHDLDKLRVIVEAIGTEAVRPRAAAAASDPVAHAVPAPAIERRSEARRRRDQGGGVAPAWEAVGP